MGLHQTKKREVPGDLLSVTVLSQPGAWVESLVQELRFPKPHDMAKRKKLPHSEVNSEQNENAAYSLGGNTGKSYT